MSAAEFSTQESRHLHAAAALLRSPFTDTLVNAEMKAMTVASPTIGAIGRLAVKAWLADALTVALMLALAAAPAAAAPADTSRLHCSVHILPVRLTDPGPADQSMWGQLCFAGPRPPATVQLLVHGAFLNHTYWDSPIHHGFYSYVRHATAAGYATFAVDRIGYGNSSHPDSSQLTMFNQAVSLHDAITALRAGAVGGFAFSKVMWVGHSFGSAIGWVEIARYHDVDAALLTGQFVNARAPEVDPIVGADIYPAVDDPKFANSGLDLGYLTTKPGTRESLFFDPKTVEPEIVAADEAGKDTLPGAEFTSFLSIDALPVDQAPTNQITVPVLLMAGANDFFSCFGTLPYNCADPASVLRFEAQFFTHAQLRVVIIPRTGHCLALSTTAPRTDAVMLQWSRSVLPPRQR